MKIFILATAISVYSCNKPSQPNTCDFGYSMKHDKKVRNFVIGLAAVWTALSTWYFSK